MNRKSIALLPSMLCLAAVPALAGGIVPTPYKHVLLLSVDGMHAVDLANYIKTHPGSAFATLSKNGNTYPHAACSRPSDSFPGLMAQVTGGGPATTSIWYDDSYDRSLLPPIASGGGSTPGTEVIYNELIDKDQSLTHLNGGGNFDASAIDPNFLPRDPITLQPIYPHTYLRVNTIFEVAHNAGRYTAWSDKHPAYEIVGGPTGTGLNDFFGPEINAAIGIDPSVINPNLPGISHLVDADFNPNNVSVSTTTNSVKLCEAYDDIKVSAILNQIDGKTARGAATSPVGSVPAIFGMNFQAVSVGQKLTADFLLGNQPGGYTDAAGTPTAVLQDGLDYVDSAIGRMVNELSTHTEADGTTPLLNTTLIIISAKHGQSPIDPARFVKTGGHTITTILKAAGVGVAQNTDDDVALVWLKNNAQLATAVQTLSTPANRVLGRIQALLFGAAMKFLYDDPTIDPRTPDLIVLPIPGTIYTKSTAKHAEHGGFTADDTNVLLLASNPGLAQATINTPVATAQIAPTILAALGLNPNALQAVQKEHTQVLPGFSFGAF